MLWRLSAPTTSVSVLHRRPSFLLRRLLGVRRSLRLLPICYLLAIVPYCTGTVKLYPRFWQGFFIPICSLRTKDSCRFRRFINSLTLVPRTHQVSALGAQILQPCSLCARAPTSSASSPVSVGAFKSNLWIKRYEFFNHAGASSLGIHPRPAVESVPNAGNLGGLNLHGSIPLLAVD